MIGLVLVTHGKLAEEFRHALEHVVGPQSSFETVCIGPEDDMDQRRLDIVEAVSRAEKGHGVRTVEKAARSHRRQTVTLCAF